MRLSVRHVTRYSFDTPARGLVQTHKLIPSTCASQNILSWTVSVGDAIRGAAFRDSAGDMVETISVRGPVDEMVIEVSGEVETTDLYGVLRNHRETVPPTTYLRSSRLTRADTALRDLSASALEGMEDDSALNRAHALARAVNTAIAYVPGETEEMTTAAEALSGAKGVCQDHSHALIALAHAAEIPARYVAGYLHSGQDATGEASHAWAELFVPGLGWVGFDASNRCCPDERYIRLCSGYDAQDAAPIRGILNAGVEEHLDVSVAVMSQHQQ
ncbi:transglutaminase family protein [Puniceibacterium confluentis]|uniref:transglutaminase family protein n=1 Tax=Puniceibacterium confluentis TaxID=1958944 RepID=UPI0011B63BFC|nr:transglutaminase family protein [Puniceibacterium confluentis]